MIIYLKHSCGQFLMILKNQINNNFHEVPIAWVVSRATTKLKFMIFMNTKWANKKLLIFFLLRFFSGNQNVFIIDNAAREKSNLKKRGDDDERKLTHLILIYIIYFEEFIMNLMRFETLMPFLWLL